jgi:hypothetical protein
MNKKCMYLIILPMLWVYPSDASVIHQPFQVAQEEILIKPTNRVWPSISDPEYVPPLQIAKGPVMMLPRPIPGQGAPPKIIKPDDLESTTLSPPGSGPSAGDIPASQNRITDPDGPKQPKIRYNLIYSPSNSDTEVSDVQAP